MKPTKQDVSRQFGKNAHNYATSAGHARGSDLAMVVDQLKAEESMTVLDVATGAGHTACAVAPLVKHVVAVDLASEMVAETKGLASAKALDNVDALVMDVEALAFADESFDAVTCRIAPHHFLDIEKAVSEIARVIKQGGVFVLEDSISPASSRLDRFINEVETLRDPTHVRSYTKAQWKDMLESAGFRVEMTRKYRKTHNIAQWMDMAGLDAEGKQKVLAYFRGASTKAVRHYQVTFEGDLPVSYTDDKIILRAVKK